MARILLTFFGRQQLWVENTTVNLTSRKGWALPIRDAATRTTFIEAIPWHSALADEILADSPATQSN